MIADYLIVKNGLYYRPNHQGYTGVKDQAGRYTREEAQATTHPNGWDGPRDGMTFIHESAAPDYSENCWQDVKQRHMQAKAEAASRRS